MLLSAHYDTQKKYSDSHRFSSSSDDDHTHQQTAHLQLELLQIFLYKEIKPHWRKRNAQLGSAVSHNQSWVVPESISRSNESFESMTHSLINLEVLLHLVVRELWVWWWGITFKHWYWTILTEWSFRNTSSRSYKTNRPQTTGDDDSQQHMVS